MHYDIQSVADTSGGGGGGRGGGDENINTIPDHFLKAHIARYERQYARARVCREQFCDDDERSVAITDFLPINENVYTIKSRILNVCFPRYLLNVHSDIFLEVFVSAFSQLRRNIDEKAVKLSKAT